jgi:3-phenylpropionate/trans-cinnamate dioxygenase ferredoxin reductase subunit
MSRTYDVVVVGAGAAGLAAATSARQTDRAVSILLVNGEDRSPYKRTRISKSLRDGFEPDQFTIHPDEWYREQAIDRLDGARLSEIDRDARTLRFDGDHEEVVYGRLILATGGEPILPRVVRPHEDGSFSVLRSAHGSPT